MDSNRRKSRVIRKTGNILYFIRLALGESQEDLAREIGVSRGWVIRTERTHIDKVSRKTLARYAGYLDIAAEQLSALDCSQMPFAAALDTALQLIKEKGRKDEIYRDP